MRYLSKEAFSVGGAGSKKYEKNWEAIFGERPDPLDGPAGPDETSVSAGANGPAGPPPGYTCDDFRHTVGCERCGKLMYRTDGTAVGPLIDGTLIEPISGPTERSSTNVIVYCSRECAADWYRTAPSSLLFLGYPIPERFRR